MGFANHNILAYRKDLVARINSTRRQANVWRVNRFKHMCQIEIFQRVFFFVTKLIVRRCVYCGCCYYFWDTAVGMIAIRWAYFYLFLFLFLDFHFHFVVAVTGMVAAWRCKDKQTVHSSGCTFSKGSNVDWRKAWKKKVKEKRECHGYIVDAETTPLSIYPYKYQ